MSKRLVFEFKVTGRSNFPLDMLRYDACYPGSQESVAEIQASFDPRERMAREQRGFEVTLRSQISEPTAARWNSFQWRVADVRKY